MPSGASARRYAQAVFEIAVERGDTEQWMDDLSHLADYVADEDFMRTLAAPRIPFEQKQALLKATFGYDAHIQTEMDAFWTPERRRAMAEDPKGFWTEEHREAYSVIYKAEALIAPLALNLMLLLASRNQVHILPSVADRFQEMMDAHNGVARAEAVSAVPLTDEQRGRVADALADFSGEDVRLTNRVDPEILGGMVIRIGDKVLDGSARTRLQNMRRELAQRR